VCVTACVELCVEVLVHSIDLVVLVVDNLVELLVVVLVAPTCTDSDSSTLLLQVACYLSAALYKTIHYLELPQ
jgi:glucose-6-phosphate-specific signal transduction histidine kinase